MELCNFGGTEVKMKNDKTQDLQLTVPGIHAMIN